KNCWKKLERLRSRTSLGAINVVVTTLELGPA
ncbi:MAG: hypothetical protein ACI9F9_000274, partial [Candidatus Paceibacteria bacterium]